MNTEELMKLADAYANQLLRSGQGVLAAEARAALEAALSTESKIQTDTPMTDEQIEQAYREIWRMMEGDTSIDMIEAGIRYAERYHGIKG